MNAHTFKPCPWCDSTDVAVESEQIVDRIVTGVDENNGPVYWSECQHCWARGPLVGWAVDAIPKWNEYTTERDALRGQLAEAERERDAAESKALAVHEVLAKERDAAQARVEVMEKALREAQAIALSGVKYHKKPYDETPCAKRYQSIADIADAARAVAKAAMSARRRNSTSASSADNPTNQ